MLFNSIEFIIFLPIVFVLYWFFTDKSLKLQNSLLFVASYVFYGWWDWRFLSLIAFSSFVDYYVGLNIGKTTVIRKRKLFLIVSILVNIGFLGFFKYFNFFVDSFSTAFTFLGNPINPRMLNIVLPVGISFYTFQTLSYSIDIYRGKLKATKDPIAFFAFVSFFPQLVAGPIERASHLLPQFYKKRLFDKNQAVDGLRQMLWGLFKKVVVADNVCKVVEPIFENTQDMSTGVLLLGLALFSVQIYSDFSGYSDIAIGCSRLFGFELKVNFRYPLFARSVGERWRNWHISLSTWFRDYIYIPMGGSRGGKWNKAKNTLILFTISGFWHGANWTFVFWGILNGLFLIPAMLLGRNRRYLEPISKLQKLPSIKQFLQIVATFWLIAFTYVFFRADNIQHSKVYFMSILTNYNIDASIAFIQSHLDALLKIIVFISILLSFEWLNRDKPHGLYGVLENRPFILRWGLYFALIFIVLILGGNQETFIYFQF